MRGAWTLWKAFPRTLPYLRPYRKRLLAALGVTLCVTALSLAEPWPLALILDSVIGSAPPGDVLTSLFGSDPGAITLLIFAVSSRFMIIVLGNALTILIDYWNAKTEQHMVFDLRSDLFEHCQRLSFAFHDRRKTGQLMSQINMQSAALGNIVMAIPPILEATLTLVGMLVIILLIDWQIAVLSMLVVPFLYLSFGLYGTRIVPRIKRVQQLEWQSLSIVHEAMAMLRVIVSFGREKHEHKRFREQGKTAVDERVRLTVSQNLYTLGVQTATAAGTTMVLGVGAWHVMQGKITVGEMVIMLAYLASVYQPLEQISTTIGSLHEQFVQFDASLQLLDTEPEIKEAPDAVALDRAKGHVQLEDASFDYQGRRGTLRDVSLEARPGETVAIVGPTGAGKTTLMSLLMRFYDPKAGRILIDGIDLRKLKLDSLREQISVVLQEPLLFSGTLADNIRYGKLGATDEEVVAAARAANAHDFISRLPDGYDTQIGERGAQLSGGERQRIAVARAFLKDSPILILDEPTSSIDSRTEEVILDALDELIVGRTAFMIAHRLSTVRHADQIVVISEGRIVERGTHDELLRAGGAYRELHDAQSRERRKLTTPGGTPRDPAPATANGGGLDAREDAVGPERPRAPAPAEPAADGNGAERATPAAAGEPNRRWGLGRSRPVRWRVVHPSTDGGDGRAAMDDRLLRRSHAPDQSRHPQPAAPRGAPAPALINLNEAGVDQLMRLPGVGAKAAARIVADREARGPFRSVHELVRVERFDESRVRRLLDQAKV